MDDLAHELPASAPAPDYHELGEATFRQILDAIADMVLVKGPHSHLLWANKAFLDAYGMSNEQLQGLIDAPFVEPDFTQQYVKDDFEVFSTGRTLNIPEDPLTSRDRGVLVCQTVKSPIFDRDGRVIMTVGVSRDVTERKRLEAQMVAAKEAAEAALRVKSEFLATMSHEIRTPLNGVLGMIELLMTTSLDEEQRACATSVQACGRALLGLIGNVLDLSKIEAGYLRMESIAFDPAGIVRECLLVVAENAAAKQIELTFDPSTEVPTTVLGDRERVRQVVLNLLSNAVKFTETGRVSVSLSARPSGETGAPVGADPIVAGPSLVAAGAAAMTLEFGVEDTGIGMSAETVASLFRPFHQGDRSTTRRYGGTGLGLAISQRIVQHMGGRIEVTTGAGRGSRFSFALPFALPGSAAQGEPASSDARAVAPKLDHPLRILVAEDNAVNRTVIVRQLSLLGHTAHLASNGSEALIAARAASYDLVLMDCQMPEMDGYEATRQILAEACARDAPPPYIVAVTANAMAGDRERCLSVGMSSYLSKPVGIEALRRVLERWS